MNDEQKVKAALSEAYQYATGRVYSDRSVCAFLLGRSWEDAAGHSKVKVFWHKEALKIDCQQGCGGAIGVACDTNGYICPERIKAAEAAWEKEHACNCVAWTAGGESRVDADNCPTHRKQEPSDELSQLRKENEELKAAKMSAEATVFEYRNVVNIICSHIQDRMNMKDEANPETYLKIIQSDCENVERGSKQIVDSIYYHERLYLDRAEKAESALEAAREAIRRANYGWEEYNYKSKWFKIPAVKAALEGK